MYIAKAPSPGELISQLGVDGAAAALQAPTEGVQRDRYLHWDKLRRLEPPDGLSSEQWWLKIKLSRGAEFRSFPLRSVDGDWFGYTVPDRLLRQLHRIDQRAAGEVAMDEVATSEHEAGHRFLVNSLMEEAIRSSQLEGATTSRVRAKELLRSGREPKDRSELMIANNYRALQFMREEMGNALNSESVLELHRIVTAGTLDDSDAAGRLQQPGEERVAVYDRDDGEPVHIPPPAEQLPERLAAMCEFANEGEDGEPFIHPVLRAILLHFWLAYDHPFEDGNGRTARILFFWAMQARGYWLAEYLPISRLIRKAPGQYVRAFVETETDGGDTTYFLLNQLQTIERAIEDLHVYLQKKIAETRNVESLLQADDNLNGRQLALLTDAIRRADARYTFASHATSHRVTHETARSDLRSLVSRGLLNERRNGRQYIFDPVPDIDAKLRGANA